MVVTPVEAEKTNSFMRIRIQKRAEVTGGLPAIPMEEHVPGQIQNETFSLPIDYTVEGEAEKLPQVGESFWMMRDTRNGVKAIGEFTTSPVTEVTETTFRTKNSVYDFKVLTTEPESV